MTRTTKFEAPQRGWVAGRRVEAGEHLELTAAQAKYERVTPVIEKPAKPARKAKVPAV